MSIETLKKLVDLVDPQCAIVRVFHLEDVGYVVNVGIVDGVNPDLGQAIMSCYNQFHVSHDEPPPHAA